MYVVSAADTRSKHYLECDVVCKNMSEKSVFNMNICIEMCDKMMTYHEQGIRAEILRELDAERSRLLSEDCTEKRDVDGNVLADNCSPSMTKEEILEYRLKSAEIDTKYIVQLINDIKKDSEKVNKNSNITMILEGVIIVVYLLKPCVMYFIQAKYKAERPHPECRGEKKVLTEQDVVESVEMVPEDVFTGNNREGTIEARSEDADKNDVRNRYNIEFV